MPQFDSNGVTIDYSDDGEGPLMVLVHGYASNRTINWHNTSWVKTLTGAGYRVVALDNRGHGKSEKLYDSAAYQTGEMAADVVRLLDHLGADTAVVMGYSMGSRIAAFTALAAPERVSALILSGLASNLVDGVDGGAEIAAAMEAGSVADVTDPGARAFRVFAEQTKSDRKALAACIRASRQTLSEAQVHEITAPTLVVAGDKDDIAGSAEGLAALMQNAEPVSLPGRDHMTAVGDKGHKEAVLAFLKRH
ncbi:alpha/beta hydrolase [Acuticoccus sp. MNP-M23]|uniref:alpha/beta fold hydrolase n=1 Tax=Acuticoccus sp. MNP-M23 TaxID=3072793 RepID=UPI0028165F23|nr:alpha/beta hydrolase [Acuticoccus sp. MNP-M23]WMS42510.1 alpha/beta hydrolase [Acuticoccus sp. MNP-M23]